MALALVKAQQGAEAQKLIAKALTQPKPPEVLLAAGQIFVARKDRAARKEMFQALIDGGHGGYDARLWLGKIAVDEGDLIEAEEQLRWPSATIPTAPTPTCSSAGRCSRRARPVCSACRSTGRHRQRPDRRRPTAWRGRRCRHRPRRGRLWRRGRRAHGRWRRRDRCCRRCGGRRRARRRVDRGCCHHGLSRRRHVRRRRGRRLRRDQSAAACRPPACAKASPQAAGP